MRIRTRLAAPAGEETRTHCDPGRPREWTLPPLAHSLPGGAMLGIPVAYSTVRFQYRGKAALELFFSSPAIVPGRRIMFSGHKGGGILYLEFGR